MQAYFKENLGKGGSRGTGECQGMPLADSQSIRAMVHGETRHLKWQSRGMPDAARAEFANGLLDYAARALPKDLSSTYPPLSIPQTGLAVEAIAIAGFAASLEVQDNVRPAMLARAAGIVKEAFGWSQYNHNVDYEAGLAAIEVAGSFPAQMLDGLLGAALGSRHWEVRLAAVPLIKKVQGEERQKTLYEKAERVAIHCAGRASPSREGGPAPRERMFEALPEFPGTAQARIIIESLLAGGDACAPALFSHFKANRGKFDEKSWAMALGAFLAFPSTHEGAKKLLEELSTEMVLLALSATNLIYSERFSQNVRADEKMLPIIGRAEQRIDYRKLMESADKDTISLPEMLDRISEMKYLMPGETCFLYVRALEIFADIIGGSKTPDAESLLKLIGCIGKFPGDMQMAMKDQMMGALKRKMADPKERQVIDAKLAETRENGMLARLIAWLYPDYGLGRLMA